MSILYPTDLPTAAFAELVDVLTSGDLAGNADRGLKAAWIIQGWGQGRLLGDPDGEPLLAITADEDEQIRIAAAALFVTSDDPRPMAGPIADILISAVIERVLEYVIEAIRKLLEARQGAE